jgi:hypothetical protein
MQNPVFNLQHHKTKQTAICDYFQNTLKVSKISKIPKPYLGGEDGFALENVGWTA